MKSKSIVPLIIIMSLIVSLSCTRYWPFHHSDEEVRFSGCQIPGCNPNGGLFKTLYNDTCFTYTFDEKLSIECCVNANCCPDHDRFDILQQIKNDTIFVTVADTAMGLCNCLCNYIIRLEWENLPENAYTFVCYAEEGLKYQEFVRKK